MDTGCPSIEFQVATGIWTSLAAPTALSVSNISGQLTTNYNLGGLNDSIYTCYKIISGAYFDQNLAKDYPALYIYGQLYIVNYYATAQNQILASPKIAWTSMGEGDARITRTNIADFIKAYQTLRTQSQANLDKLINNYRMQAANPQSLDYYTIQPYTNAWTWGIFGIGGTFFGPGVF